MAGLLQLYAGKLSIAGKVVSVIVKKTAKASPAFIKELMRRSTQFMLHAGAKQELDIKHVEAAIDEMLFAGGSLNVKMLGGAAES